jgi:hypothetical protein
MAPASKRYQGRQAVLACDDVDQSWGAHKLAV